MQKFVDLVALGTKLQIISAFALDHVKGFIYIEAERQNDVNEVLFFFFVVVLVSGYGKYLALFLVCKYFCSYW